ncbi:phosphoenolpyruvate synthase [Bacillus manliponensis]|uniref:phosphoenolpyruvate synthase n=1 Tax=Bacillus manliponensis TaxID=574376 RepID=UPI003512A9F6
MHSYVVRFKEIDKTKLIEVGGKGLNLGELSRIEGIAVPDGFCVTTHAYKRVLKHNEVFHMLWEELLSLKVEDRERISEISSKIRNVIEAVEINPHIAEEVSSYHLQLGEHHAYAVRSSATAEDLPQASFAGQQDTYLNIIGKESILHHIRKCWASLFTDRAVIYRIQNGFDHRHVYLSVVIQRMVFPQASGIMFTADPVTSNRKTLSIDASFGLGEALVSGLVSADNYKVREGNIVNKTISTKRIAIYALQAGGTEEREVAPNQQTKQTLTEEQILELEQMGRKIEKFFSYPQDIEWCLVDDTFYIVQSRPITTLFPIPNAYEGENRVYVSLGHQQMMTEPIKPLGMSFFQALSNEIPFYKAGGRLFVDYSHDLATLIGRKILLNTMEKSDPLVQSAFKSLIERKDFVKLLPRGKKVLSIRKEGLSWSIFFQAIKIYYKNDPTIVQQCISRHETSIRDMKRNIANVSGDELFTFIVEDMEQLKKDTFDSRGMGAIMAGIYARSRINKKMEQWLGDKNAADVLSQSVANNVTSEMGLALLDVADVVRQYPEVIEYFHNVQSKNVKHEIFFEKLVQLEGGNTVSNAIEMYLEKYGMRCTGEIDITRTRWSEQPAVLVPMILSNIKNFEPHASSMKFEQGRQEAEETEQKLLNRLQQLRGGLRKVKKTKKMISVLRNFIGYREYPKYAFINRYYIYKKALLKEAEGLVQKGIIREKEDIYYLTFEELREVVCTNKLNNSIITERKKEYEVYEKLTPPRVITSEGECVVGKVNTDNFPPGSLAGIAVSSGVVEGRARVISKMEEANLEEGDILVTAFTDPSWTPLFVSIKGLITEVGGVMTHGAVIAREYGLPAVVGVDHATKEIKDGQQIRVNGTEGYIEIL